VNYRLKKRTCIYVDTEKSIAYLIQLINHSIISDNFQYHRISTTDYTITLPNYNSWLPDIRSWTYSRPTLRPGHCKRMAL